MLKTRLISFLGTAEYRETAYRLENAGSRVGTRFVARALAELFDASEVFLLATSDARDKNGTALAEELAAAGLPVPRFVEIPFGSTSDDHWDQFEAIKKLLRPDDSDWRVVLDITHGFRSQPFLAAAAVAFVRSVDDEPVDIAISYGAFEARDSEGVTPVWDLTRVVELLDWSRAMTLFLKTGRVEDAVRPARKIGNQIRSSSLKRLAGALERFGQDLATVRTGDLLLGRDLGKKRLASSVGNLAAALSESRDEMIRYIPPLGDVHEKVLAMLEPLVTENLQDEKGRRALAALARLYFDMERFSEAATTVRESWVTTCATPEAARPGSRAFDVHARAAAESVWRLGYPRESLAVSNIRNDIDHGGYNDSPARASKLIDAIEKLVARLESNVPEAPRTDAPERDDAPRLFLNISNHPSNGWEESQKAAALQLADDIVDMPFPDVPPEADTDAVRDLARETLAILPQGAVAAMVSGEFTLTTALVSGLTDRGIACYCATTERQVVEGIGGVKTTRFRFIRFRKYPN